MTFPLLDAHLIKKDFPIFDRVMRGGNQLVYLDSGATSQKPLTVLDAERQFYTQHNAAVHRGSYLLAEEANESYDTARQVVATFLGGKFEETIFTKSATEALNLLAYSFAQRPSARNARATL